MTSLIALGILAWLAGLVAFVVLLGWRAGRRTYEAQQDNPDDAPLPQRIPGLALRAEITTALVTDEPLVDADFALPIPASH